MTFKKVKTFGEMIKFEHSVFALPFAYLSTFWASKGFPNLVSLFWITVAMVSARTAAMSLNRLIDRHIDANNPRTKDRHIPRGILSIKEVWVYIIISFGVLLISAWELNPLHQTVPLTVKLMPIAVFFLSLYSYTKRFTWLCHLVLGISIGLGPVGAWVGITGKVELPAVLLGVAVATWIAGFDVIYACQDFEFDRNHGLFSIPACFGVKAALWVSNILHVITVALFIATGLYLELGNFYWIGVVVSTVILIYEHSIISPKDLSRLAFAFFNMNGIISVILCGLALLDYVFPNLARY